MPLLDVAAVLIYVTEKHPWRLDDGNERTRGSGRRCFWGIQDLIRKLPGVMSTRVGYAGGDLPNATYANHGTHAEAIEIVFDPAVVGYRDLLEFFFKFTIQARRIVRETTAA
jgi:hypothetical protein